MPSQGDQEIGMIGVIGRILTAAVVLSWACVAQAASSSEVEAGRHLAQTYCGACHAVGASDPSPRLEAPPFRRLHERYPIQNLEEALGEGIFVGHTDMPRVIWEAKDIQAFIAYLQSLQPLRPRARR
jgi:cytochrome c